MPYVHREIEPRLTALVKQFPSLGGPMAGALFETYCVQETVKALLFQGITPRLYYLRLPTGLEVDLLIERDTRLFPYEIKLTKTPRLAMADALRRLTSLFPKLPLQPGGLLCLAEDRVPLSKNVSIQPLTDYWRWLKAPTA